MTRFVRRVFFLASLLTLIALPVLAQEEPPEEPPLPPGVHQLVFPVDGPHHMYDSFGDCRSGCSRSHEGVDIVADKMIPVLAAADGVVINVRGIDASNGGPDGQGQYLVVQHDGWQTRYLHLNNDTPGTDDGMGLGIIPEIIEAFVAAGGDGWDSDFSYPVEAGQMIGWVGDSGNAENSGSHLHFELRIGEGWSAVAIDPYPHLLSLEVKVGPAWNGFFSDDDASVHEADIETLAADGTTKGCNPPENTMYCPERLITRGEIAAFIRRTLQLPAAEVDLFADDAGSVFEGDINAVAAAGIGFGCTETDYCPDQPLLRDEMAEMLIRSFAEADPDRYANPDEIDFFGDDTDNRFEESINRLMAAGVTKGCNPPDNDQYCPDRPLNRAEMASFFVRALGR
ncbi:MAG TPA: M23 family metallopeptidase [Acidimicrobiia bacterium]|nr:M23 family metallopeptidase [Acidimicrobiia bacterium]